MLRKIIISVFVICCYVSQANEDTLEILLNVSTKDGALGGCIVSVQQGGELINRLNTDDYGNVVILLDKKTAKKAISITCTQLGYYNRQLQDIKVVDGEEFNVIMDPLTDPDVISVVESVLGGKDVVVVMTGFTKQGEESEEEPEVEEPEKEKKVKDPKLKKEKE